MTPTEFKAWFDGFTEALTGTPNKDQWKRLKARVAEIDGNSVTERVFVDRYWRHHWPTYTYLSGTAIPANSGAEWGSLVGHNTNGQCTTQAAFSATAAMNQLGRLEAS